MKQLLLLPAVIFTIACASETKQNSMIPESTTVQQEQPIREKNNPMIMPQPFVSYRDSSGATIRVFHFIAEPEKIRVTAPDGSEQILSQVPSVSGIHYVNSKRFELIELSGLATYSIGDSVLFRGKME